MFQVTFRTSNNNTAGVERSVTSDEFDDLAGFVETGAVCDRVENKKDVRICNDVLKLIFRVLKRRQKKITVSYMISRQHMPRCFKMSPKLSPDTAAEPENSKEGTQNFLARAQHRSLTSSGTAEPGD